MRTSFKYIRWFEIALDDVPSVGGKTASLGEMYRALCSRGGIRVPNGFAPSPPTHTATSSTPPTLGRLLSAALNGVDPRDVEDLSSRSRRTRELVYAAGLPRDLQMKILASLEARIGEEIGTDIVAHAPHCGVASAGVSHGLGENCLIF